MEINIKSMICENSIDKKKMFILIIDNGKHNVYCTIEKEEINHIDDAIEVMPEMLYDLLVYLKDNKDIPKHPEPKNDKKIN